MKSALRSDRRADSQSNLYRSECTLIHILFKAKDCQRKETHGMSIRKKNEEREEDFLSREIKCCFDKKQNVHVAHKEIKKLK